MKGLDYFLYSYYKMFKEGFPMYQLGRGRSDDEIITIIKECIKKKKDVYELKMVEIDDIEY